jgi:hypothetical protein
MRQLRLRYGHAKKGAKFQASLERTHAARAHVPADLRPLFDHLINLAHHSHAAGYAKRAGRELLQARRLMTRN